MEIYLPVLEPMNLALQHCHQVYSNIQPTLSSLPPIPWLFHGQMSSAPGIFPPAHLHLCGMSFFVLKMQPLPEPSTLLHTPLGNSKKVTLFKKSLSLYFTFAFPNISQASINDFGCARPSIILCSAFFIHGSNALIPV